MRKYSALLAILILIGVISQGVTQQQGIEPRLTPTLAPPDLTVTWMKFTLDPEATCFIPGMSMGTQVFIENIGQSGAGAFQLELIQNGNTYTAEIPGLAANTSTSYWFSESGTSTEPVTATVDSTNVIAESDETNNTLEQMLPIPTPYISCTPTPDESETPTPETPTAEVTVTGTPPTSTPTDVPGTVLIVNGGFEVDTNGDKFPDGWTSKNVDNSKIVCNKVGRPDKPDKIVSYQGNCAFQFKTAFGKLKQKIAVPEITVGSTLVFSVWVDFKNITIGFLDNRAKVAYTDGTSNTLQLALLPTQQGVYLFAEESLVLEKEVAKIKVQFRPLNNEGSRIRIDEVLLWIQP